MILSNVLGMETLWLVIAYTIRIAARLGPVPACPWCPMVTRTGPGFRWGLMGKVHLTLLWVNHGQSHTGPVQDLSRVALAQTGPEVPVVPRTNPVRDQTGNVNWDQWPPNPHYALLYMKNVMKLSGISAFIFLTFICISKGYGGWLNWPQCMENSLDEIYQGVEGESLT